MNHLDRQQLADIYASTHTIAVIGASADPAAAVLARRIG
jgi:predicted CoA-binding protein